MDAVFLPPVLIVCAILLGCVLVITHRRVREHADTGRFREGALCIFRHSTGDAHLIRYFRLFLWKLLLLEDRESGLWFLAILLGVPACFLGGVIVSFPFVTSISHVFWKHEPPPED